MSSTTSIAFAGRIAAPLSRYVTAQAIPYIHLGPFHLDAWGVFLSFECLG